jgi:DNA repair exonuclease SbcCD nuclease subunit
MKILRVGDPHVTVSNLKESEKLLRFIVDTAVKNKVDVIEFLGDLMDTHSVIRSEVLNFWRMWFNIIDSLNIKTFALVGNHDQNGDTEREQSVNSLNVFDGVYKNITIVNKRIEHNRIMYLPHFGKPETFLAMTHSLLNPFPKSTLLVAHQTFIGAEYESGFPAEDGIDIDSIPQEAIISGHIHKSQQIGKVFYTGAPRWLKSTDADTDKGIWIFEHNKENPAIYVKEFISVKEVVTPIIKIVFKEGEEEPTLPENAKVALELIGESAWIAKMRKKYKGKASIRAVPSDRKASSVDKSKLVDIEQFLAEYVKPNDNFGVKDVIEYIRGVS